MTIRLPLGLEDLNWMVGMKFPDADEDALWRLADSWRRAADQLRQLNPTAVRAGSEVVAAMDDDAGRAFAELWEKIVATPAGYVAVIAEACDQLAEACDSAAVEVEYAKLQYIAALVILAATIAWLLATVVLGGVSAAGIPVAVAAAHFTIRLLLARLLAAVVVGAGINVIIDALVQFGQIVSGHRDAWDLAKTGQAAQSGAIFGAVGGGAFLLAGKVAPGLLRSSLGMVGTAAAANTVAGLGMAAVDGELPTANGVFTALVSGTLGALGPDLVGGHPRMSTPEFRLGLDGDGALTGITGHLREATGDVGLDGLDGGWTSPARADQPGGTGLGGDAQAGGAWGDSMGGAGDGYTALAGGHATSGHTTVGQTTAGHTTASYGSTGHGAGGGPVRVGVADGGYPPTHQSTTPAGGGFPAAGAAVHPIVEPVGLRPAPGQSTPLPGNLPSPAANPGTANPGTAGPGTAGPGTASPGMASPGTAHPGTASPGTASPGTASSGPAPAGSVAGDRTPAGAGFEPAVAVAAGATHAGASATATATPGHDGVPANPAGADQTALPVLGQPLTDLQAVEVVRQNAFATDAGFGFYSPIDQVRVFADAVNPTPGYVTLDLHGSPRGFNIADHVLTPEQFGRGLRDLIDQGVLSLPDGAGIKLLSCDTAVGGPNSPAARLARAVGVEVIAPDQPVWTALDGQEIVASPVPFGGVFIPKYPPDGQWHRFDPAGVDVGLDFDPGYHGDNAQSLLDSGSIADERGYLARAPDGPLDIEAVRRLEPEALAGRDPAEIAAAIPDSWLHRPSKTGGGEVFEHPTHRGEQLRLMPGYPVDSRPDPVTHGPYAVITKDGTSTKVPLLGNPTTGGNE